jgi:anthranilate phosphoribosyltransferase
MLMGVPRPELCEPLAQVLQSLGVRRAMVVCGKIESKVQSPKSKTGLADASEKIGNRKSEIGNFSDELSTLGENTIAEFYQEHGFTVSTTLPENFPLQPATLTDLLGGDKNVNAKIVREILSGAERGPKRDAVLLNAAAALFVAGKTKSLAEGWDLAGETIDSGRANEKLAELAR